MTAQTYAKRYRDLRQSVSPRRLARHLALDLLAMGSRAVTSPALRLLFCHFVFDDQKDAFERQILALKQEGQFISGAEVLQVLSGQKPLAGPLFHLSFDDGFANVLSNAWPILRKHKVPATFFVPSGLIEADEEAQTDFFIRSKYSHLVAFAKWDELKRARDEGMEIGSHTRTHARFSDMSGNPTLMEEEIAGSKTEIEKKLGAPCPFISWPYGKIEDADPRSLSFVKAAGYAACFGAFRGRVEVKKTNRFSIPRHHFEPHWPLRHLLYFARGGRERA